MEYVLSSPIRPRASGLEGVIVQVSISPGGLPKWAIPAGVITSRGLAGDAYAHPRIHGGPLQSLLLITAETIEELKARGYPVYYGALGENLTIRGIDRRELRIGDRLRAGEAVIEITKVRGPCAALDIYGPAIKQEVYDRRVKAGDASSPRWGMSGFYARVIEPGRVRAEDPVTLLSALA